MELDISFRSINPTDNILIKRYSLHSNEDIKKIIDLVGLDFNFWKNQEINFRLNSIKNLALLLNENLEIFSKLITNEMGKPL